MWQYAVNLCCQKSICHCTLSFNSADVALNNNDDIQLFLHNSSGFNRPTQVFLLGVMGVMGVGLGFEESKLNCLPPSSSKA